MRFQGYMNRPTKEMIDFYNQRTLDHCSRVKSNCRYIASVWDDRLQASEISHRGGIHDSSKFGDDEYIPYVWMSWFYKMKQDGIDFSYPSQEIEQSTDDAWAHHARVNSHHPEYHFSPEDMSSLDIIEMVCDWVSMSQEFGGSTKDWADKNIGSKWEFNVYQIKLIYHLIGLFK
jgi:hypothetical protein